MYAEAYAIPRRLAAPTTTTINQPPRFIFDTTDTPIAKQTCSDRIGANLWALQISGLFNFLSVSSCASYEALSLAAWIDEKEALTTQGLIMKIPFQSMMLSLDTGDACYREKLKSAVPDGLYSVSAVANACPSWLMNRLNELSKMVKAMLGKVTKDGNRVCLTLGAKCKTPATSFCSSWGFSAVITNNLIACLTYDTGKIAHMVSHQQSRRRTALIAPRYLYDLRVTILHRCLARRNLTL